MMHRFALLIHAAGLAAPAAPLAAQEVPIPIWAYESRENYCPQGLQPVTYDGAISCGTPNQTVSYQTALREPRHRTTRRFYCDEGSKGCR